VLDDKGQSLNRGLRSDDYCKFFAVNDIFQGWLGNCFHVGAMMALTKNQDLLEKIIPSDNALKSNMALGAYHFRFWKLGSWFDVVIDDFLPTNNTNQLLFSHNNKYPNEFWMALFEKSFAK
jgi:hypothetical protein